MLSEHALLPMRRAFAAALSVALLGVVGPSMARAQDDDDSKDKKEIHVYRSGDDDDEDRTPQWNQKDDDNDNDRDSDRDDDDSPQVFRYKVERADSKGGYLGVRVQDITKSLRDARDLASDDGALVNRVEDNGPAEEAGIKRGDVIIQVGDESIDDSSDLIRAMGDIEPGTNVKVVVMRDGTRRSLNVHVAQRPKDVTMVAPNFKWRSNGSNNGMNEDQMRELREHLRQMDPQIRGQMRMNMPGPEMRREMDDLRKELDDLKRELRDLREELNDSRAPSRGRRSGS